jgi:CRP-like cAMP-binding protein
MKLLAPGEKLFRQGDPADLAYLVKSGLLRAYRMQDGKTLTLGDINPGEFVGEMAYINSEPRSADVEAVENCELIEIPLGTFDSLLFSKPTWSMALMKTLSKRLKTANR